MKEKKLQKPFPTSGIVYLSGGTESESETPKSPRSDLRDSGTPILTKIQRDSGKVNIFSYHFEQHFHRDYIVARSEGGPASVKKIEKKDDIIKTIWGWLIKILTILKSKL